MAETDRSYCLITPARNEGGYIRRTAESVISQTVLPKRWIIVSDRSTDATDEIAAAYARRHPFIRHLRCDGDRERNFGSQVRAINLGYRELAACEYRYLGNLDADISFGPDYFETLMRRFEMSDRLGLAGGYIREPDPESGRFVDRGLNRTRSVAHAVQFFRREVFEAIGGYRTLRFGGADTVAEEMARMKGWEVRSFPDLPVDHHKPALAGEGAMRGAFRQGRMDHAMGTDPLFELLRCMHRIGYQRLVLYSLSRFSGFLWQYLRHEPYEVEQDFVTFIRKMQRGRFFRGKLDNA
jgi:glycosyltransferase involved in cell wall biosynthesis